MWIARPFASLAQLVEHVICNLGVVGSSPTRGSLTRLVLETTSTIDEQIAKFSSLLFFCTQINRPQGDCCKKANRYVAFGIRIRSHTEKLDVDSIQ